MRGPIYAWATLQLSIYVHECLISSCVAVYTISQEPTVKFNKYQQLQSLQSHHFFQLLKSHLTKAIIIASNFPFSIVIFVATQVVFRVRNLHTITKRHFFLSY